MANIAIEPPTHSPKQIAIASIGVGLAVLCVASAAAYSKTVLVLGSFGSSCVLLFAFPQATFSQPRSFILGHFISSFIGLAFLHVAGPGWWSMALATGIATAAMMTTRTLHPPAGSNPLIIYLMHSEWSFLWFPTLLGAFVVQGVAIVYHKFVARVDYPRRWI